MQAPKLPAKLGAVVVAIGGVSATLTVDTARQWLELFASYGPLALSVWLLYVVYQIDKERSELQSELSDLKVKVATLERNSKHNAY